MHLTHKDIWLDYFISRQHLILKYFCGDVLKWDGNDCVNSIGKPILKFSKQFQNQIDSLKRRNFTIKDARVNFVLYWKKEDSEQEIKIILPELIFERIIED